jgi:integrase
MRASRTTWNQVSTGYLSTFNSGISRRKARRTILAFCEFTREAYPSRLTRRTVEEFAAHLQQKNAPVTVNAAVRCLRAAIDKAVADGVVPTNPIPADEWPKIRETTPRLRVLTDAEETALLASAADHRFRAFMRLTIATGGHRDELLSLTWEQIDCADPDSAAVAFPGTSRHKARRVPINRDLVEMVARMQRNGALDAGPFTYWTANCVESRFRKAAKVAGIEGVGLQDLVRLALCRWVRSGLSITQTCKVAGTCESRVSRYRWALAQMEGRGQP